MWKRNVSSKYQNPLDMCRAATSLAIARAVAGAALALACAISVRSESVVKSPSPSPSHRDTSENRRISNLQLLHPMVYRSPPGHGSPDESFSNIPSEAFTLDNKIDSKRTFKKDLSQILSQNGLYSDNESRDAEVDYNDLSDALILLVKQQGDLLNSFDKPLKHSRNDKDDDTLELFTPKDYYATSEDSTDDDDDTDQPLGSVAQHFIRNFMQNPSINSIYSNQNKVTKPLDKQNIIDIFTKQQSGTQNLPMTPFVNRVSNAKNLNVVHHDPHNHNVLNQKHYGISMGHYSSNKEYPRVEGSEVVGVETAARALCGALHPDPVEAAFCAGQLSRDACARISIDLVSRGGQGARRQASIVLGAGRDQSGEPPIVV